MNDLFKQSLAVLMAAGLTTIAAGAAAAQTAPPAACADDLRHNATREQAEFADRNGRTIRGLIYRPQTANGAAVVLLHSEDGLGVDAPRFDPHAIQLATRGYHVLVPNYYDARPGRARKTGLDISTWSDVAADAVSHVGTLPGVDAQRVGLWGYSLGGFLATDGSMNDRATARVAVGVATGTAVWQPLRGRRAMPMLMIHGRSDPDVPAATMRDLASSMRLRGATVDVALIDSSQHFMEGPIWCEVFQHTRRFLDAHLLPAVPAA